MFPVVRAVGGVACGFPRVCGDVPCCRRLGGGVVAVFPAYAGMFRRYLSPDHGARRFPRVCGDVPIERALAVVLEKFSPRMRGCS